MSEVHETRQERLLRRAVLYVEWEAQPDDRPGGDWCVTLVIPYTPAQGNRPIVAHCTQETAEHVARIHNEHLPVGTITPAVLAQIRARIGEVKHGE